MKHYFPLVFCLIQICFSCSKNEGITNTSVQKSSIQDGSLFYMYGMQVIIPYTQGGPVLSTVINGTQQAIIRLYKDSILYYGLLVNAKYQLNYITDTTFTTVPVNITGLTSADTSQEQQIDHFAISCLDSARYVKNYVEFICIYGNYNLTHVLSFNPVPIVPTGK